MQVLRKQPLIDASRGPKIGWIADRGQYVVLLGSWGGRWAVAALLAAFCAVDAVLQYGAAATRLPELLHLSGTQTRFLKVLNGCRAGATSERNVQRQWRTSAICAHRINGHTLVGPLRAHFAAVRYRQRRLAISTSFWSLRGAQDWIAGIC